MTAALERAPTYAHGYEVRGWMHEQEELWERAASDYARAIELGSKSAQIAADLGHLLDQHLGRPAEAEPALRRAILLDPHHALARFYLGEALAAVGRADEARANFQDFLARADASEPREAARIDDAKRRLGYW